MKNESTITLSSGAVLELKMAPFVSGTKLMKVVSAELKAANIDLAKIVSKDNEKELPNILKDAFFQCISSDALQSAFFECAGRSLHNGEKITPATFESSETRGDYLPTAWEVIKFNLLPFVQGLGLSSLTSVKQTLTSQP
jgi:hypothetical protein